MGFEETSIPLLSGLTRQPGSKFVARRTFYSVKIFFGQIVAFFAVISSSVQSTESLETAIFAGGCFWCMEEAFEQIEGVVKVESGYTGGIIENPSYDMVSQGKTKHLEAIRVTYNSTKTQYEKLLGGFWDNVDPFDGEGQFCDQGEHYRSAVFYGDEKERGFAVKTKEVLKEKLVSKAQIHTMILPRQKFYPAEEYHQDYYKKNPYRYNYYKFRCGRSQRLKEIEISSFTRD